MKRFIPLVMIIMLLASLMLVAAAPAAAGETPGTVPAAAQSLVGPNPSAATSLQPVVTETGKITLSLDGLGTASSGNIQVNKPAGAVVRSAFLATADMWTGGYGGPVPDTAVLLNGSNPSYTIQITAPAGNPHNAWADVTSIVKATIDAAPAGIIDIAYEETSPSQLDGSILAVIFDDPAQTVTNTVVLMFGAQNILGDTFVIGLANPIDKTDPNLIMDFSLGISYSAGGGQYSQVDVNSIRMTTSAGGYDDGYYGNGGLLTVGGIGDTNANPVPPVVGAVDDELYNILPFVTNGQTSIVVDTLNPSNDDNIFFAGLFLASTVAVVNEGITLGPDTALNPLGETHTVTAKVQDDSGAPVAGRLVTFTVTSGPNAGLTGTATTDVNGVATFSYTSTTPGTDTIVASFIDSKQQVKTSNEVTKTWEKPVEKKCLTQTWNLDSVLDAQAMANPFQMEKKFGPGDDGQTGQVSIPANSSTICVNFQGNDPL